MNRLTLALLVLLAACAAPSDRPPPETVAAVDLPRYLGTWFEIARLPNSFQDGAGRACAQTTATYEARPDGTIGVMNRCRDAAGAMVEATARAYAVEGTGNSKLRVSFFWPFYGDYWVIGLVPDYRWAVVGAPGRNYLWVLSRTPTLPAGDYAEAVGIAAAQGFDIARLRATPQD